MSSDDPSAPQPAGCDPDLDETVVGIDGPTAPRALLGDPSPTASAAIVGAIHGAVASASESHGLMASRIILTDVCCMADLVAFRMGAEDVRSQAHYMTQTQVAAGTTRFVFGGQDQVVVWGWAVRNGE